jgi:heme-degrading monooxygenase HmoA
MPYLLVQLKVQDFARWKAVFDEHGSMRGASGSKGGHVFQSADDPNAVVVVLEWDDLSKAREFIQSADLRQAMERSGVIDQPGIYFLEQVDRPTA